MRTESREKTSQVRARTAPFAGTPRLILLAGNGPYDKPSTRLAKGAGLCRVMRDDSRGSDRPAQGDEADDDQEHGRTPGSVAGDGEEHGGQCWHEAGYHGRQVCR